MTTTPKNDPDAALLERVLRYQDILADYSRLAAEAKELGRLLQLTCVQAARGIGIKRSKIMRYRPTMGDLLIEAGVGWKPGVVGQVTLGTDVSSPPGRTLQTRQPVITDDLPNSSEVRYAPVLQEHGIVSALNTPIAVDSIVWGVIEVDSEVPRHFTQSDVQFLTAMANILGMAVQRKLQEHHTADIAKKAITEVEQQKMLMRELLHRDKNDFQMVMALLVVQEMKQSDPGVRQAFRHVMDRVSAISMAHDQLAMRPGLGTIDVAAYLQALCGNLDQRREGIHVRTACEHAELVHERAVPLGLITNELVTNAIKHAFPSGQGVVTVTFTVEREIEHGCLIVADNGVGMGPPRPGSSGLQLVRSLAAQVGGSVEQTSPGQGTMFRITVPLVV
ncbi:sensor histidine kinase [Azospirillum himalayense]|uniref:histidine kinase n=1 Tax=Azospirillum himalayense TaxID=654847 RepID=A0ABW0G620_9PROT